jgi:hypothetical protein
MYESHFDGSTSMPDLVSQHIGLWYSATLTRISTEMLGPSSIRALKMTRSGEERVIGARCRGGRSAMLVEGHEGGQGSVIEGPRRRSCWTALGLRGRKGLLSSREGGSLIPDPW